MSNKAKKRPRQPTSTKAESTSELRAMPPTDDGVDQPQGYEIQPATMVQVLRAKLTQERDKADVLEGAIMQLQQELAQARETIDQLMEGMPSAEVQQDQAAPADQAG